MNHMGDDEILDAILRCFGVDGFDSENEDNLFDLAAALHLPFGDEGYSEETVDGLHERIESLLLAGRVVDIGCYSLRLSWTDTARRLVGNSEAEIVALLTGGAS